MDHLLQYTISSSIKQTGKIFFLFYLPREGKCGILILSSVFKMPRGDERTSTGSTQGTVGQGPIGMRRIKLNLGQQAWCA